MLKYGTRPTVKLDGFSTRDKLKMRNTSTKIKILAVSALSVFTLLGIYAAKLASGVTTDYAMEQFFPLKHPLLLADQSTKKVFQISENSPHILLMSIPLDQSRRWTDPASLTRLRELSTELGQISSVKSVISLGNIRSSVEHKGTLTVADLVDLQSLGFGKPQDILSNPLYTPNLVSRDARDVALFIFPKDLTHHQHQQLIGQVYQAAKKQFPRTYLRMGGPAVIRTQLIDLLSQEILLFIFFSLLASLLVVKFMFHGVAIVPQILFILVIVNALSVGMMSVFGFSFNVLSSTLPIIVTITALGITCHTLVRMSDSAHLNWSLRMVHLKNLMRELALPHALTAITPAIGFATLALSDVPLIASYGKAVAIASLLTAATTIVLVPAVFTWAKWPTPRSILQDAPYFSHFLIRNSRWIVPSVGIALLVLTAVGSRLSWTAKLFDDLPRFHTANHSTNKISRKLGGIASVDFSLGHNKRSQLWKQPVNLRKLKRVTEKWRTNPKVGSVIALTDFMTTGRRRTQLPLKQSGVAELQFLYSMAGDSPLKNYLSVDEKWTRVSVRLPDLPANESQQLIAKMTADLKREFPKLEVRATGTAVMVPKINDGISRELMWGFFGALFWIVLAMTAFFRSLRWALVATLPNLVPPTLLIGFLAIFQVPIKPGIAIIFSISLGLAFCNTVYVLDRLRTLLRKSPRQTSLPIFTLMKHETMPCLVSSLALFAGFSVFLFSAFPVNQLFGLFMLLSILAGLLGDLVWLPALLRRFPWLLIPDLEVKMTHTHRFQWQTASRAIPYVVLFGLGVMAYRTSFAAENAQAILSQTEKRSAPPNERVALKMITQESDGSKKVRELTILRTSKGGAKALVRLQKPADLKGLSLLTVAKGKKEEQYLYLPSDKKVRRILGSNKKGKFLDSEIAFEDLSGSAYRNFNNRVVKDTGKLVEIESTARADSDSSYGRIRTWISKPNYRVEKMDHYDSSGKLLKQTQFLDYEKLGGQFWRARNVIVKNVQDRRQTQLLVKHVSLRKIASDEISVEALED